MTIQQLARNCTELERGKCTTHSTPDHGHGSCLPTWAKHVFPFAAKRAVAMGKKKAFIDKKKAITFSLVHEGENAAPDAHSVLAPHGTAVAYNQAGKAGREDEVGSLFSLLVQCVCAVFLCARQFLLGL